MTVFAECVPCSGIVPLESLNGILECALCGENKEIFLVLHSAIPQN